MQADGFTILIVDDNEPAREMLAWVLGDDYPCRTAASAEQAVELLADNHFNLVLTDLQMPGASGLELCRTIKQTSPETIVLIMSSANPSQYFTEAMQCGASGYLTKPDDLLHIDRAVKSLLGNYDF